MTTIETTQSNHQQISQLAYLNWQKDGCHHGHDLDYWLKAEAEIKAAGNLSAAEVLAPITIKAKANKTDGAKKISKLLKAGRSGK